MTIYDNGAEQAAYDRGFSHGDEQGRYLALEEIKVAPPQDFSDPEAIRLITNRSYLRHLQNAQDAGIDDERARILELLKPFLQKALLHEVTVNDARRLQYQIEGGDE